jgi:hypothetical protein
MATPDKMRKVLQLVEMQEFAKHLGYSEVTNEVIDLWISEGHAALFDKHFRAMRPEVLHQCQLKCGDYCKGDPSKCKLRHKLHKVMKDKRNW